MLLTRYYTVQDELSNEVLFFHVTPGVAKLPEVKDGDVKSNLTSLIMMYSTSFEIFSQILNGIVSGQERSSAFKILYFYLNYPHLRQRRLHITIFVFQDDYLQQYER